MESINHNWLGQSKRYKYESGAFKRYKKKMKTKFIKCTPIWNIPPDLSQANIRARRQTFISMSEARLANVDTQQDVETHQIDKDSVGYSESNESYDEAALLESVAQSSTQRCKEFDKDAFITELKCWVLNSGINHEQLRGLLKIWNTNVPLPHLPSDPRTVLNTPREVEIINGNYWHYGLRRALNILRYVKNEHLPVTISLRFNMDGLPISKSSSVEVWPILVDVAEVKSVPPCIVGLYCGKSKPQDIEGYLNQFVLDLNDCLANGIIVNDRKILVEVKNFVLDSPARAVIKGTVYYNHSHGCQKCTTVGSYSKVSNTMTFNQLNAPLRNNDSFRNEDDPYHHRVKTPLFKLPIDLVQCIPVGDALHLLHLGLMKRFLTSWRDGVYGYETKWSTADVRMISEYLLKCKVPAEIHRQMRSMQDLCRWKGTELRTFLLYVSIAILKKHLPKFYYEHYLLFYCSIVILNSDYFVKYLLEVADGMIKSFLDIFKRKYGACHFVSNLHNLCHLVDEVKTFGPLGNFDSYPFENRLQAIKKLVRQRRNPLAELAKRILEQEAVNENKIKKYEESLNVIKLSRPVTLKNHDFQKYGSVYSVYEKVSFHDFQISNEDCNKWFLTKDYEIVACNYIISYNESNLQCVFYASALKETCNLFEVPMRSSTLFIYAAKSHFGSPKFYTLNDFICKMFRLPYAGDHSDFINSDHSDSNEFTETASFDSIFVPLWHTLN